MGGDVLGANALRDSADATSMEGLNMRDDKEMHATIMGDAQVIKANDALKKVQANVDSATTFDEFCNQMYAKTQNISADKMVALLLFVLWAKLRSS
jgi:hypothetical protein